MDNPVVTTTLGPVRGTVVDGVARFLGIPYAAPPTGPRRFRPAAPASPWTAPRDAAGFGPAFAQVFDPHEGALAEFLAPGERFDPAIGAVGDEDALTLNLWTPATPGAGRPVVVWIHGGANWLESSRLSIYSGHRLAAEFGAVFVSLNYRLGIFGFLDLTVLGPDAPHGAHASGLSDQRAALAWVRANAASFGGDAHNITLMGGSAGAMDISWLMAAGALDGAVQRVVLMSGVASVAGVGRDGAASVHALAEGRRRAHGFLQATGLDDWPALADLPAADILARHAAYARHADILFDIDTLFYPRVDGALLRHDPFQAAAAGALAGIDVMLGFTDYEMGLWLAWDDALDRRPVESYAGRLPMVPAAARARLAGIYDAALPDCAPGQRAMHMLGDAMFVMPTLYFAELLARHNPNVWVYDFAAPGADPRRGALHAADQGFFFGLQDTAPFRALFGLPPQQEAAALGSTMRQELGAFIRGGAPTARWPSYGSARQLMRFDWAGATAVPDPLAARRAFWFDAYVA